MIIIINGAFGIGKTTVGQLLWRKMPGSRLYNPEWVGSLLIRIPGISGDFQNLRLWRRSVILGTRLARVLSGGTVIVPMTFTRKDYLDEVVGGLRRSDRDIRVFCLRAGLPTILERLERRGRDRDWGMERAEGCIEALRDERFGEPVDTEGIGAKEVANEILRRLDIVVPPTRRQS